MRLNFILYFFFKSVALVSFVFSTPILLKGLGYTEFGIWSTVSSFVSWILVLDFGIGNYLRNKIADLSVQNRQDLILDHFSKAFALTSLIAFFIATILGIVSFFIDWSSFLGVNSGIYRLFTVIISIIFFTSLSFISNLIYFYFYGLQKSYVVAILQSFSHVFFIVSAYLTSISGDLTLLKVSLLYGVSLVIPGFIASVVIFSRYKMFKYLKNSFFLKDFSEYLNIGGKFFLIQLTALILFSTDKILLSNIFGPEMVTEYEVIFKVFSVSILFQSLLLTPSWGKYSKDFYSKNYVAIKKLILLHISLFMALLVLSAGLMLKMDVILELWLNTSMNNPNLLISLFIFAAIMIWNNIFAIFLNATNHVELTFKICIVIMVVNIPLSYYLAHTSLKESGIVVGSILSLLPAAILTPIQTYKILKSL